MSSALSRWLAVYQSGTVPARGMGGLLRADERMAVCVFPVRYSTEPLDVPFERWDPLPGSRSLRFPFRNDGSLVATSQRLLVVKRPTRGTFDIRRQWEWADVASISTTPNWRGLAVRSRIGPLEVHVIGQVFHTLLVKPSLVDSCIAWSKAEAAWFESRGRLDRWMSTHGLVEAGKEP